MASLIKEETLQIDGKLYMMRQQFSDGHKIETTKKEDKILIKKIFNSDGSYIVLNGDNYKIEELTSEGIQRKFDPSTKKIIKEISKDGTVKTFYPNGRLSTVTTADNTSFRYYENGNLSNHEEKDYALSLDYNGKLEYELKDGNLTINPDYFSFYRLGIKTKDTQTHWQEKTTLSPHKKTLVCLGGDQTKDAKAANGNINAFTSVLGLSKKQLDTMQLCSCYRSYNYNILHLLRKLGGTRHQVNNDFTREILQKFMPFMAHARHGKFEKYTGEELAANFRNIIIQAHCAGANDLSYFSKTFNETLHQLGYTKQEKQKAMQQIICITNNSQREFTDDLGFTMIHRYSVKDGQFEPEYESQYSDAYPLYVENHPDFISLKGKKSSFISLKPNEVLMIFDKILKSGDEHNEAFWTTDIEKLTIIGKKQVNLMQRIGQFWYNNSNDVPNTENLLISCSQGTEIENFVRKSITDGKKLKMEQRNPLKNHHILKSAWNKFNNPDITAENTGINKFLSLKNDDYSK